MFQKTKIFKILAPILVFFFIIVGIKLYSDSPINNNFQFNPTVAGAKEYNFGSKNSLNVAKEATPSGLFDQLTAQSVYVYDITSKKSILAKNPNTKMPTASTLKILTGAVTLDNATLQSIFTVSEKAANVGEDSMLLSVNEKLTVEELLYGLMLPSGNDAAITLAEGIAGSEQNFVDLMNQKVKYIGMDNTYFVNSSGLEGDGEDYSTARDMTQLAAYVWSNYPIMQTISGTYNYLIPANNFHKSFDLYNETNLLTTYPGVKGLKPGYTPKAGYCLITVADINGHEIIITMLNSQNRREEMRQILDHLHTIIN